MTTRKTLALNPEAATADAPALKKKGRGWEISDSRLDALHEQARALRQDGVVLLQGVIDPALLAECLAWLAPASDGIGALPEEAVNWTNPGRYYATLPVAGPLAHPALFANPQILAVARAALGGDCVLDSFGVIVSHPGAEAQHVHKDGALFPDSPCDRIIPAFALTFAIPLVALDARNGSTGFFLRSHVREPGESAPDYVPEVSLGSALLWDYRIDHRGEANRSERPRPVLFGVYCRSWWQDAANFDAGAKPKLLCDDAMRQGLDDAQRRLLQRATPTGSATLSGAAA